MVGKGEIGRSPQVPGLDMRPGQVIAGRYRIEGWLGTSPAGVVLAAHHIHLRKPVTLKILTAYTASQREALTHRIAKTRQATRLRNEHVARIVDVGFLQEDQAFIASERLEGVTLEAELDARGRLPVDEAVRRVLEACEALAEAHAMGLVHGDLKPSNLLLAKPRARQARGARTMAPGSDDARILQVLDFGMTSPLETLGDGAQTWTGSPAHLAPEQIRDPETADARCDLWALGVILYELVSGTLPFTADTLSGLLVSVVYDAAPLLTDAPYELACIVARCLDKDPEGRPRDIAELARTLAPFAGPEGVRLSDRVRATLSAPPPPATSLALEGDAWDAKGQTSSISPLAVSIGLAPEHGDPWSEPTRPSIRVQARRRSRRAAVALAMSGVAVVALAGFAVLERPTALRERVESLRAGAGLDVPAEVAPPMVLPERAPLAVTPFRLPPEMLAATGTDRSRAPARAVDTPRRPHRPRRAPATTSSSKSEPSAVPLPAATPAASAVTPARAPVDDATSTGLFDERE